ncbi:MAG: hypothetical protein ACI8V2_001601 [Candidatus Latescibacterota bacterium]|jgi:hypothetical protein
MKTIQGIYKEGQIQLIDTLDIKDQQPVLVIIPDTPRETGIDPSRNKRINEAKQAARKRIRERKEE